MPDPYSAWDSSETADLVSRVTREDLAMDRRAVLQATVGVVAGGILLEHTERWLSPIRIPAQGDPRPSGIGIEEIHHIEHAARVFRDWDHRFGGGLRRKAVIGQLSEVADELRDHSHQPHLARRLFAVMAHLAGTAATMSWDSGRAESTQRYYLMALRAAREAGDRAFGANILAGMARQLLSSGHPADALELIGLAQDGSRGAATPSVLAMLHSREAWAYAQQGRLAAFRRTTSKAEDILRAARPGKEPHWITYFDEAELAGVTGGRLLDLARDRPALAADACTHIQHALQVRRSRGLRSCALDQIGLAQARLVQAAVEEACGLGHQAVDLAEQTRSDRVRRQLADFHRSTGQWSHIPDVAALRDRMWGLLIRTEPDSPCTAH